MRIMRSDDEQIVSAQGRYQYGQNNIYYSQQSNSSSPYDAEVDFSYSGRQFMNELVRDRQFGTGNIRPVERDRDSFSEMMYQDAIEEASRVKTMGYFNDLSKIEGTNPLHNTIPGRLREKASVHLSANEIPNNNVQKNDLSNKISNNVNNMSNNSYSNSFKNDFNVNIENKSTSYSEKMAQNNVGISSSIAVNMNKPGEFDDLMNKVRDNIQHEIETQLVEEGRQKLREEVKVQVNNLPYKKTKEYTGGSFGRQIAEQQLQVRDYKVDKSSKGNKGDGEAGNGEKMGIMSWIFLFPFMIVPLVGFLVSGVISFYVPKDPAFKGFARFCLTIHMVMSLVAVYMYFKGYLDISLVKRYINF